MLYQNLESLQLSLIDEWLEKALLAHNTNTLERRVVMSGTIQTLSSEPTKAKEEIRSLLIEGYRLAQNEAGLSYLTQGLMGGSPLDDLVKKLDTKPAAQRSVFITYQWKQKETAKAIHAAFEAKGFLVIRDEDTLQNNVYLPGFMQIIGHQNLNYVLPIITESYLKSKSCMYEVNQVMKRYQWQKSLLPYIVTQDAKADAHIYSGAGPYVAYWRQELQKAQLDKEKEVIENILKNIEPFIEAMITRINISEPQMIAQKYQPLFDMIGALEKENEHVKFKEIEELLTIASNSEKKKRHDKVKEAFEAAIKKVDEVEHLQGVEAISAKTYGFYAEYLLRQNKDDTQGKDYLEIALNFGFVQMRVATSQPVQNNNSNNHTNASSSSSSSSSQTMTFSQSGSAAASSSQPIAKAPVVSASEVKQFLKFVVEGEQEQAEAMLKKNKDLALCAGEVTDLSGRTFEGITGFQYAVWALDWHMWTMIFKYLNQISPDAALEQAECAETGSWVRQYGSHADWTHLIDALKTLVHNWQSWSALQINQHWVQQVGGAQLLLPAHVVNEYCHPTRSFNPCPDFTQPETNGTWRTRQTNRGEWFICEYNEGKLGKKFAFGRGSDSNAWASQLHPNIFTTIYNSITNKYEHTKNDHEGMKALYDIRVKQYENFIVELKQGRRRSFQRVFS